jgi:alcohol dehydrogenase class IV
MRFEFVTATRIIFGRGTLKEAGSLAKELGRRALLVTGRDAGRANQLTEILRTAGIASAGFAVPGEPEIATVQNGTALAKKERCDLVISLGGGSAIDAGKAIAAMLTNAAGSETRPCQNTAAPSATGPYQEGELLDYLEVIGKGKALTRVSAPFIAIPTTAGTGSEVTRNAVLGSPERRVKVSLRSPLMLPRVALVDPELTRALPPALTASTGLDALTQLIEPYVCTRANPMTDAICVEGMRRAAKSLRGAVADGSNMKAREDMCVASLLGGLALANAGLGAVHGFAGPFGGMFPAPHGAICAALLPQVMEMNCRALRSRRLENEALRRYEEVARLLTGNPQAGADEGIKWVSRLVSDLQIPRLSTYGLTRANAAELIEKAAQASSMKANPVVLTPDELAEVLERAF